MPKTSRDFRTMARTLAKQKAELLKLRREHRQTVQNAVEFKEMVLVAKKEYDKKFAIVQEEANILRQSLKNFSGPYYKQRQALRKQAKMLKAYRVAKKSRRPSKTCI